MSSLWAIGAQGAVFGLVVAVSDYDHAPLQGTLYDAAGMVGALMFRGAPADNIYLNVDAGSFRNRDALKGLDIAHVQLGAADKNGLNTAFERIAARASAGDQILVYMSGHGGQRTDADYPAEPDGLDEVFYLHGADLSVPVDQAGDAVFSDDEIGAALDRLRGGGADVLFIGDFCHSGDAVRGHLRAQSRLPARESTAIRRHPKATDPPFDIDWRVDHGRGALTAIYAAPSNAVAVQALGPVWVDVEHRKPGSILSMYAADALLDSSVDSYRLLKARILLGIEQHLIAHGWMRAGFAPPQFEGLLDHPVLAPAVSNISSEYSWVYDKTTDSDRLDELRLNAGALHGLQSGDILAFAQLTDAGNTSAPLFFGRVVSVAAASAVVRPVDFGGVGVARWQSLQDWQGGRLDYRTRLLAKRVRARDERSPLAAFDCGDWAHRTTWRALIERGLGMAQLPQRPQAADSLSLCARSGHIELRDPDGVRMASVDVTPAGDGIDTLIAAIDRARRFVRLRQVLRTAALGRSGATAKIEMKLARWSPPADAWAADHRCPPSPRVPSAGGFPAGIEPIEPSDTAAAFHVCDVVWVEVTNRLDRSVDVTVLAIEPNGQIEPLDLAPRIFGGRLPPDAKATAGYGFDRTNETFEAEIALIAVGVPDGADEIVSFRQLCRPPVDAIVESCGSSRFPGTTRGARNPERIGTEIQREATVSMKPIKINPYHRDVAGQGHEK